MYSANHWGGTFEIHGDSPTDDDQSRNMDLDRSALSQQLSETQQSWLLGHGDEREKKSKYIDLGCIICSRKVFKWTLWTSLFVVLIVVLPTVIVKTLPKHTSPPPPPDNYTIALHKALLFFNAQKSGKLPVNNGIPWRGNSGLSDGSDVSEIKGGLVGGYYDAGDNIKFHFPLAFSMTMLSWTVVEYGQKYKAIGEYDHVRDIIKWGTDYLLKTFNSSASTIDHLYAQVGSATNGSTTPDDHYCWERPENMDYPRQTLRTRGADISGEMAAALAAASIVFRDDPSYSKILVDGAATLFKFARSNGNRGTYSKGNPLIDLFYNSTGYYDEYMWGAAWLYYATGNSSYLNLATNPGIPRNAHAFRGIVDLNVLSWDNKLPAAMLLLTRMRIFLNPGYPYEEMLRAYYNSTGLTMCSYLQQFNVFNFTKGGMIELNHGRPQPLQYVANAAFLAKLYADYMNATGVPGWWCGPKYFSADVLIRFAQTQINYILGSNPKNMSYLVGYGSNYPKHVHHRGASTPNNGVKYSCTGGWKWRDAKTPNPNVINGAMVGGPDRFDGFLDVRGNYSYTEPTMAGNAGLVAALIALTASGDTVIDRNTIFSAVPPLFPPSPPPPPPWKP